MSKNVAVFVDVANIFYAAKAAGVDIDYVTLLKAGSAGRDLVRAYAYTGLDPDNENQRNFHEFLRRHGYKVVSKDIRKYGDGKVKANLDIELVVDMMKTARNLDIAIVVSGDGDFAPAIRAVQEMGVRVEVISFRGNTSSDLIEVADQFTEITQLAKVEKGSSRSGRRVADDEDDLSMTEVPDKQSEGTGDRRRGRGRGRPAAEPVAAAPRARVQRSGRTAVPVAAMGDAPIVVLPGEKLSRAASVPPAGLLDADDADEAAEAAEDDDGAPMTDADGAPLSEDGQRRRRRRRGGRGRGRGRSREDGVLEGEAPPAAAAAAIEPGDEVEDLGPVAPAPRRSGFSFGSVWDSQIGIPPAAAAGTTPGALAPLDDDDLDEPPIPEYLIAERRQRDARSGRGVGGGGGVRGRAGSYAAAIDRERYGGGRGTPSRFAEQAPRDRGPVRLDRPPVRPVDRPAPRSGSDAEPWSEVPPEIEAMLRAQLGSQGGRPARRDQPPAPRPVETVRSSEAQVEDAAPAPRRRGSRQAAELPAGTEVATSPSGSNSPAADEPVAAPATRRRLVKASAATSRKATATASAAGAEAAPKRRTVRRTAAPSGDAAPAEDSASPSTDESAAPKRRATRKKAEPTA